jgi:hypothetical protein
MFAHQKFWRKKISQNTYQRFDNVEEAKTAMGFTHDNIAFDFSLCSSVEWQLHDNIYLSYMVTFNSNREQIKFIDNKHLYDNKMCFLSSGVDFDSTRCKFDW